MFNPVLFECDNMLDAGSELLSAAGTGGPVCYLTALQKVVIDMVSARSGHSLSRADNNTKPESREQENTPVVPAKKSAAADSVFQISNYDKITAVSTQFSSLEHRISSQITSYFASFNTSAWLIYSGSLFIYLLCIMLIYLLPRGAIDSFCYINAYR
jgi:hypothetical protein